MNGREKISFLDRRRWQTIGRRLRHSTAIGLLALGGVGLRADPAGTQKEFLAGNYPFVISEATLGLRDSPGVTEWTILLIQALLAVGRNAEADAAMTEALTRDNQSLKLRWLARDVAYANGRPEEAKQRLGEIRMFVNMRRWGYRSPAEMVIFGRTALLLGADPKDVLEQLYGAAQKMDPKSRDVYLARGDLALEKHDFPLAAKVFEEGLKQLPDDPDLHHGRALAYANGDREQAQTSLNAALKINPRHVPTLLQFVNHHIDGENYIAADKLLDEIIAIHPTQPDAWALRAVLAHLRNDAEGEAAARATALSSWANNPRVDFLIGQKLSAKYRFAEGAAAQRRARDFDPEYLPASAQLANDLLRLGEDEEGWSLVKAVHERDEYDVEIFNLVTLHDTMGKYVALKSDDFVVRMASSEVTVYGPQVLALLRRAKKHLTEKYGVELAKPTYIEIFADPKDFAVRTFGLPDVAGFLGVCFGRVVTANSPASSESPTNWESVLWHEFCHVVTLQMTKNKMPRWLSEGISVYEEWQANPSWGMRLDPKYREMMMGDDLVPVGKLSAAFLSPKTSRHLQFAYLESAYLVQFIIERYGLDKIRGILRDLRDGGEINTVLAKHTAPLATLEEDFATFARAKAAELAPKLDWTKPEPELLQPNAKEALAAWEKDHPDNYWLLKLHAQRFADQKEWPEARRVLERLIELYPGQKGADTPYRPLVAALAALGDTAAETEVLRRWVELDDEAPDAYARLMELAAAEKDWATVATNAKKYLAVNPLVAPPYRYQAQAAGETGDVATAVVAWKTLLQLDVPDPAEAHFQLARLLQQRGEDREGKRHVLLALEEAPRYREALRLLVDFNRAARDVPPPAAPAQPAIPIPVPGPPVESLSLPPVQP